MEEDSNVDDEFDKMLADAIRRYRKTKVQKNP